MAGITLAQAESALAYWLAADEKLASGQSYSIKDRSLTRAETQEKIIFWEKKVKQLSRGGMRVTLAVPGDH